MHEPIKRHVEGYLSRPDGVPVEFTDHLLRCQPCREELAAMKAHSELVRSLRVPADIEPRPGFYARVVERIESQKQNSFWALFLEPAFGRRIAVAAFSLALLIGVYLFSMGPIDVGQPVTAERRQIVLPGEDQVAPVLGADEEQNRGAVLVNLVTYEEQ
jgi:hypothetical protein